MNAAAKCGGGEGMEENEGVVHSSMGGGLEI